MKSSLKQYCDIAIRLPVVVCPNAGAGAGTGAKAATDGCAVTGANDGVVVAAAAGAPNENNVVAANNQIKWKRTHEILK